MQKKYLKFLQDGHFAILLFYIVLIFAVSFLAVILYSVLASSFQGGLVTFLQDKDYSSAEITAINDFVIFTASFYIILYVVTFIFTATVLYFSVLQLDKSILINIPSRQIKPLKIADVFSFLHIKSSKQKEQWIKTCPIKLYIANYDLETRDEETISATVYPFAKLPFNKLKYIKECLHENKICLDEDEFNLYFEELSEKYTDVGNQQLREALLLNAELQEKNTELESQNAELKKTTQTSSGRKTISKNTATKGYYIGRLYSEFKSYLLVDAKENSIDDDIIKEKLFEFLKSNEDVFEILASTKSKKEIDELIESDIIPPEIIPYIKKELGIFAKRRGRPKSGI